MKLKILWLGISIFALEGCRFGNYADSPKLVTTPTYQSVEAFETEPTSLQTAVLLADGTQNTNSHTPLSAIPAEITQIFTDPLYYAVPIDTTQSSLFVGFNQASTLDTTVDTKGNIDSFQAYSINTLWSNPNCQYQDQITQTGLLDRSQGGAAITFSDGSQTPSSGHLVMDFTFVRVIAGDCAADLQTIVQCYQNGTGCTSDELSAANGLLDLYVNRAGILNLQDVPNIKNLVYQIHFE